MKAFPEAYAIVHRMGARHVVDVWYALHFLDHQHNAFGYISDSTHCYEIFKRRVDADLGSSASGPAFSEKLNIAAWIPLF